MGMCK